MLLTTLTFEPNQRGTDPLGFVEGVPAFPGTGHKGIVKVDESWECEVLHAAFSYVMIRPIRKVADRSGQSKILLQNGGVSRQIDLMEAVEVTQGASRGSPRRDLSPFGDVRGRSPTIAPVTKAPSKLEPAFQVPSALAPKPAPPAPTPPPAAPKPPTATPPTPAPAPALPAQPVLSTPASPPPGAVVPPAVAPPPPGLTVAPAPASRPAAPAATHLIAAIRDPAVMQAIQEAIGVEARIERAVSSVENELLSILEGNLGQLRKGMKDLGSQVEAGRRAAMEWERAQWEDPKGVPKPRPVDPERPTDAEVEREIVHQLYRKNCWGAKYGQYEALKRGHNSKAPESQVKRAVKALEGRGWIMPYPKSEEQYRLNPQQAGEIYRFLGVSERRLDALVDEAQAEPASVGVTRQDLETATKGFATMDQVARQIEELRRSVATIKASPMVAPEAPPSATSDIKEALGLLRGLQGEMNRVKAALEALQTQARRTQNEVEALKRAPVSEPT